MSDQHEQCIRCGERSDSMFNDSEGPYCGICHGIVSNSDVPIHKVEDLETRIVALIKERDTYHQRLKEAHVTTEEWRSKYNDMRTAIARLIDDPPSRLYLKDVLMTILARPEGVSLGFPQDEEVIQ